MRWRKVEDEGTVATSNARVKKSSPPEFLNRIEVILALHQQAKVRLQNVAVGDATNTYRELAVNASADFQAAYILLHQRQY
jgi:ATP-dependent Clp protease ATP-binding subunit ClpA